MILSLLSSLLDRWHRRPIRLFLVVMFAILALWAAERLVMADRPRIIYVFPTTVAADGWSNADQAVIQDLSTNADLVDFGERNSASILFGKMPHTAESLGTTSESMPPMDVTPSLVPVDVPIRGNRDSTPAELLSTTTETVFPADILNGGAVGESQSASFHLRAMFSRLIAATAYAEDIAAAGSSSVTSTEALSPRQIFDPRSLTVCETLGTPCHILELSGFGISGEITTRPVLTVRAHVSLASKGGKDASASDRIVFRVARDGVWKYLGEVLLGDDISNARRGGYLTFDVPSMSWADLVGARISIEYVRASNADAEVFLDGAWFSVEYADPDPLETIGTDATNVATRLSATDAALRRERRNTLMLPGRSPITFLSETPVDGAGIVIKTDVGTHITLGAFDAYLLIANDQDTAQDVQVQFLGSDGLSVESVSRWMVGMPFTRPSAAYATTGYACDGGWESRSGTTTVFASFFCPETKEVRVCDAISDDKTNCLVNTKTEIRTEVGTRDGWQELTLIPGSQQDDFNIFARLLDAFFSKKSDDVTPPNVRPVSHLTESIFLEAGQAVYLRARVSVPINSKGDFVVEAAGENGSFGILRSTWSGSWNYRVPIFVPLQPSNARSSEVVAVDLSRAPESFWGRVRDDGADLRFALREGGGELPFYLARFSKEERRGLAWVRLPLPSAPATTTLELYYGNEDASNIPDQGEVFRTKDRSPRYVIVGGENQKDMSADIVALAPDVRVAVGDRDETVLSEGEHTLIRGVHNGEVVSADGPISVVVQSVGDRATAAPLALSGTFFAVPTLTEGSSLSFATVEDSVTLSGIEPAGTEVLAGSILTVPATSSALLLSSDLPVLTVHTTPIDARAPLFPATDRPLYALKDGRHGITATEDGTAFAARCERGEFRTIDGRRRGVTWEERICIEGDPAATEAVAIEPRDMALGSVMEGNELQAPITPIPESEFDHEYVLPEDAVALVALCVPGERDQDILLTNTGGVVFASTTCVARGKNPRRATFFDPDHPVLAGTVLRSASGEPFAAYVWTRTAPGSVYPLRLSNLWGKIVSRGVGSRDLPMVFGKEEFVVPGEHRAIDVLPDGTPKTHVNDNLTSQREWSALERPAFRFRYKPQSSEFLRGVRTLFGARSFSVARVSILHTGGDPVEVPVKIGYGEGNEWGVELDVAKGMVPGKYILRAEIEEGGEIYTDEFDFYWGLLAMNYTKSVFVSGETANISIAALSENGNTVCDADLRLWAKDPSGVESEVQVTPSGKCNGNNVVDVPDYFAAFPVSATGTYQLRLVRLDRNGNAMSQITDQLRVVERVPYIIEREGPTRIYPVVSYDMTLRVRALEDFSGTIVERMPKDFVVIDRGNGVLALDGEEMTATWGATLKTGDIVEYRYRFDAPDRSPYLYELGPLSMVPAEGSTSTPFTEDRKWQIASDAAGKLMIYWDNANYTPAGWTCVSCVGSDPLYGRYLMGSSTYAVAGGTYGHTPSANASVQSTASAGVGPVSTVNTINAPLLHSHTLTPTIASSSNFVSYHTLRVLQFTSAGEPPSIPAGAIVPFDVASSSLPSNWYRYAELDGRYPLAASTTKSNGGANTHTHVITGTLTNSTESGLRSQNNVINGATAQSHNHTLSPTTTDVLSNEPPYREVLYARLTATSAPPNYMIGMWSDTPADQWQTLSGPGGALENMFLKASTTYGRTGGSLTHQHADIYGATTSVASSFTNYAVSAANAQAPATHIHTVNITAFSEDPHVPPFATVIYAKRLSGISVFTQENFRFYANANVVTPTDPWPAGPTNIDEGSAIDTAEYSVKYGDVLRIRMSVRVENSTTTVASQAFKLQYAEAGNCSSALNWFDVAPIASSSAIWRGYNNAGVPDGATLPSVVLSTAQHAQSYEEENNSVSNPAQIGVGEVGEWDWVVQQNGAAAGTNYCFRMVRSDGTPFDAYAVYPVTLTNSAPGTPEMFSPFDNEKIGTTTPTLQFAAADAEINDVDYQVQISTSTTFATTVLNKDSTTEPELFFNIDNPANKAPFFSGDVIGITVSPALTNGVTYWWRVRAKDPNGSNTYGAWSVPRSFTVDTSVIRSTWFQTTSEQFQTDTFSGTNSSTSDSVMLNIGSTTGNVYSSAINFSLGTIGTAWGSLSWNSDQTNGNVRFQVEYLSATNTWMLVPDTVLPGNSVSFGTSPVSLLSIDPNTYPTLRLRANLTNIGGTPKVLDWTLAWDYNVTTPTLFSPFDNAIVATTTPYLEFSTTDPNNDSLTYQVSWSTDPTFTTSSTTRTSDIDGGFRNISYATDTDPFNSGERIRYVFQPGDALSASTTYFWRVRARDPLGQNTWSFWSAPKSFTVGTWAHVAVWYQTVDGQFANDTLTSAETYGADRVRVATTTNQAMIVYGASGTQLPKYRIWDGSAWSAPASANSIGATLYWAVLKSAPITGKYILGTIGSNNSSRVQIYDNGSWGTPRIISSTISNARARGMDIAFESVSGRAMVVSCNGGTNPIYHIWDGTNWVATGTITISSGASDCNWIRLASHPTSNEIIMLERDTGRMYEAQVWNATTSTWGNATQIGRMQEPEHEGMSVEYEASGNQAVIVASNYTNNNFVWKAWNGSAWSATTTVALTNDFDWGNLRRDSGSDNMHVCGVDSSNNIIRVRWTGSAFAANTNAVTTNSKADRRTDCVFETTTGRVGYILQTYGDSTANQTRYTFWNGAGWSAAAQVSTIVNSATNQLSRVGDGRILGAFFDIPNLDIVASDWNGSTWSAATILESSPSVTTSPYGEPFMIAPKQPSTVATVLGQPVTFSDGNSPAWKRALWSDTKYGSSQILYQVEYRTASGTWALIPDSAIPGNSSGTSTSPLSLANVDPSIYSTIRLRATLSCDVQIRCPYLNDWSIEWAEGITISGTAKRQDLTTAVTSGTVAVAVNGVLQSGKTGTIAANGQWSIDNVTVFPGNIVTVWISGVGDGNEAVGIAKYTISGDLGGMSLNERWLTLGSASTTGATLTLADISQYDNSVSGNEDIFHDVSAGGDLTVCFVGACSNAGLYILSGNIFRPNASAARTVTTYDLRIAGTLTADANTLKVSGSWRNLGTFSANTSTVIMNATSTTQTIDQTGASAGTFYHLTFGESGSTATWNLLTNLTATGTVTLAFGTTSPGNAALFLEGDLTINANATFKKGNATTTFQGATSRTLMDNTASKQDLGKILIDGGVKTLVLGSNIRATDITIGADDTLDAGSSWTINLEGNWRNLGTFIARTGTLSLVATTTGKFIDHGASNFYNLTYAGSGGEWSFRSANATVTNDVAITAGTATLPAGTLAVGGNFTNSGGTFIPGSGSVRLISSSGGKSVLGGGVAFNNLQFAGSGSWTMSDTNATTSGSFAILQGSVTLPSGTLAVGEDFINSGGAFTAGSGTVRLFATGGTRTVRAGGSAFASLQQSGTATYTFADANATTTEDVSVLAGTLVFPSTNFAIGGSFTNTAAFTAGGSRTLFYAASGSHTIASGNSAFASVSVTGAGSFTVSQNATATGAFSLTRAGTFTVNAGVTLAVGGTFTNLVGGASTTWAGSTLFLTSGTSFTVNSKSQGGDVYGTIKTGPGTQVRVWNSSAATYTMDVTGSLYSQNHAAVSGDLYIFGNYSVTSGTDYWSYATDFDGVPLGGSARQVHVRFAPFATATYSGATLQIIGGATATTTIDRQSAGNYALQLSSATISAQYYQFRNIGQFGLQLLGSSTVSSLRDGDFELSVDGGTMLTVSSTTIDANPGLQIFTVRFATSTGVVGGSNVTAIGTSTSFWRFRQHYGNFAGEQFDNDPGGNPGYIRWDDSNFVISISGNVYSDAGATPMGTPTCDNVTNVVRVKVDGTGNFAAPCNPVTGAYTISGVSFSGDTVMTVYLDTNGGPRAVNVTRSAVGDLTGINLYQNRVIVRHEDTAPMTIAKMNAYDGSDDADIPFTVTLGSPDTLVIRPDTEFWVWSGKTFAPGGNMTIQSGGSGNAFDGKFHLDNNATFTAAGTETHSIGGNWQADSGATFTAANSTFVFTATTSGKSIVALAPITFNHLRFNGAGGVWTLAQDLQVNGVFLADSGTVTGGANVTVNGTTVSGAGAIAMTGGTFQLASGGTFGGPTDWSFWNLTFAGSSATTTKTGSSTVTVGRVLSVFSNHALWAGTSTLWNLAGSSSPLSIAGTFDAVTSVFRYSATGTTSVTPTTYWRLWLAPSASGSPVYTLASGVFVVRDSLVIGDGTNGVTVNANTNDPSISIFGDIHIRSTATFVGSDVGVLGIYRDWRNDGTFTSSDGTVSFLATSTGRNIIPGVSSFGSVLLNSSSGGWTMMSNATATGAFTIQAAQSYTQASGTILAVGGVFTNYVGGAATTWDGTTLKLFSGTDFTVNSKSNGADRYDTLEIRGTTTARFWNSSATSTITSGSASVYSQNHAGVLGDLYIWGAYTRSSGNDYWSYLTDFDGADLSTSTPRAVRVRFAPGASITLSGGSLEILGAPGATTSMDRQSIGNYGFTISGGSTTIRYFSVQNADINGLRFSGTPIVNVMNDTDYTLGVSGGSMILVAAQTIDANPLKTFFRNRFSTSTVGATGYNVQVTGTAVSAWRFSQHTGTFSGEAYDLDPGGDPGYIIWDDSAANITVSGRVYADEGKTPIGGPTCDGVTQNVRLRVQGLGSYTSACNAGTGAYSISGVIFNPGDVITVYLDTAGGARAVAVTVDPATNIADMDLYQNRVIVRHENTNPITIANLDIYDGNQDPDIPYIASLGSPDTLSVRSGTALFIWAGKSFNPQGNITLNANASGNAWDGTFRLAAGATFMGSGHSHKIGGDFIADAGADVTVGTTLIDFTATTSGRRIAASSSLSFGPITFSGFGGAWDIGGVGTTTGTLLIQNGTVTLPTNTLAIGGSFDNAGGAFSSTGNTLWFFGTSSGYVVRGNGSVFGSLQFRGAGGAWTLSDANATTTGSVIIDLGTVNLPSGTLAIGTDFLNQGGMFSAGSGTLRFYSPAGSRSVRLGGSSAGNVQFAGSSTFAFLDAAATTTGDFLVLEGTTTLPQTALAVGGNFLSLGAFSSGTSTVAFTATTGAKTVDPRASVFGNVLIAASASGGIVMTGNATTTGAFEIRTAPFFTLSSGATLAVGGTFTNAVGGSATTWTGSTLSLLSGGDFSINGKTSGGDGYEYLRIASSTRIRSWNSSSTAVYSDATSSWYSQDHNAVDGALNIYGNYVRSAGTDYWSYATDFDGTALVGPSRRQVNVRFADAAKATYTTNATLQIVGSPTASTTIDRISTGTYGVVVDSANLNAQYHQWQNLGTDGLMLLGTTTLAGFLNGDFTLAVTGGSMITISSTTIAQNASQYYSHFRFATSTGVSSGANVRRIGTTTNAITFQYESGNFSGESYDEDGDDACGSVRWSNSACLFVDQSGYRWRNDDGGEAVPAENWYDAAWSYRQRVRILNTGTTTLTNQQVKLYVPYDSGMQSNFEDVRFTDASGTTTIPFWIQEVVTSASSTIWVKVPSIPPSGFADIYMYYGNGSAANTGSSGTSTFLFFDNFESGGISNYSGDTGLFAASTNFNYERQYGLGASAGNAGAQATDGIFQTGVSVGRGSSFHFYQYIDLSTGASDEPCVLFAVQSPGTANQNYAVCLTPFSTDKLTIAKNAVYNGRSAGATELASVPVTYTTGWYEVNVDWLPSGRIDATVYDATGAFFASTTAVDSSYTSGGIGFTFWGQHGGWDVYTARAYTPTHPTITFGVRQGNSGASWKTAENVPLTAQPKDQNVRVRFTVKNSGTNITNQNFRLQVAAKGTSPNCEAVQAANYQDVPTASGGCGSSPACIQTSSHYANQASTTQLLSVPQGFEFSQGQIIEDPSNQTGNISVSSGYVVENEYNLQMTAFATQSAYCFRITNGSTPLDNYSRVAEMTVLQPPTISNWLFNMGNALALTEGTTTRIYATGTVTDFNGYSDIVAATSTFYRSGVSGGRFCAANENNCYQIASTSCALQDCNGNSCTLSCSAFLQYFADPTDVGSSYASEIWDAVADVWDSTNLHAIASSSQELYTLKALTIPSIIDYGSVVVGSDTGNTNATTSVTNTGNALLDLLLTGTDLTAGASNIPVYRQRFATTSFTYASCAPVCTPLASTTTIPVPLGVEKPTTTAAVWKNVLWGIAIPTGTAAATHTGVNTFLAN